MFKLVGNKRVWRAAAPALLIVAMLGPWAYDQINVPAQYPCELPNVRLEDDFCGLPLSLVFGILIFFRPIIDVGFGEMAFDLTLRNFFPLLLTLSFTLPFFTTLSLILRRESARLRVINLVVLVLAAVAGGWHLAMSRLRPHSAPWGVVLYTVVVVGMLGLELISIKNTPAIETRNRQE